MAIPRRSGGADLERSVWVAGVAVLYLVGYFAVGWAVDPAGARSLATPLDHALPFLASSVFVYASVFPAAFLPVFVVRCPRLFARVARAYAAVIAISLVCFVLLPVSSLGFRASPPHPPPDLATWGVQLLYALDPPVNLFPSLHLSLAVLAALSSHAASRGVGRVAIAWTALVAVSILTVKQHFVVDALGGALLGAGAYWIGVRPALAECSAKPAYGWRGPALLILLSGAVLLALVGLYLAGWTPGPVSAGAG